MLNRFALLIAILVSFCDLYSTELIIGTETISFSEDEICLFTRETFANLIAESESQNVPYILGAVKTPQNNGTDKIHFVDGRTLQEWMIAKFGKSTWITHPIFPAYGEIERTKVIYLCKKEGSNTYKIIGSDADREQPKIASQNQAPLPERIIASCLAQIVGPILYFQLNHSDQ